MGNRISRIRTYTHHKENGILGPYTVKAWIVLQCTICGRFLKKRHRKYCSSCSKKIQDNSTPRVRLFRERHKKVI
jgi:hypothetical protein